MSEIQAIIFDKTMYNQSDAKAFLRRNNFYPIKPVHITKNYLRYRLREPTFTKMRIKEIEPGIKFIFGYE